jgi:hypothetical protein
VREGYDIANLPVLFSKLGWGRGFSSLRSSFELQITINHKTYTTMNYFILFISIICVIAKAFFFAAATYLIYLYIKDKYPKAIPKLPKRD